MEGGAALEAEKDTMTPTSVYQDHHSLTGDTATAQPLPSSSPAQSLPIGRGHKAPMQSRRLGGVARHIAIVIDAIVTAVTIALVRYYRINYCILVWGSHVFSSKTQHFRT